MRVEKWGNSLAVRIPVSVVEVLDLKKGDEIELHVIHSRRPGITPTSGRENLLKQLRSFRGRLPAEFKYDRDEVISRP